MCVCGGASFPPPQKVDLLEFVTCVLILVRMIKDETQNG